MNQFFKLEGDEKFGKCFSYCILVFGVPMTNKTHHARTVTITPPTMASHIPHTRGLL